MNKGIMSARFKNGKYSKYLPARLLDRYHEAEQDGELLSLSSEIALLDARIADLLKRVDTGESLRTWSAMKTALGNLKLMYEHGEYKAAEEWMGRLEGIVSSGYLEYSTWKELGRSLEQRRKLVESERRRLIEMQQTITTQQAVTLYTAIGIAVREEAERLNKSVSFDLYGFLNGIQLRFNDLMHRNAPAVVDARSSERTAEDS